ncbi:MAG: response regulator transcription factor [Anaerolinea sp.]|nr:response regulator transcription factor [Anaerolinea sp.]
MSQAADTTPPETAPLREILIVEDEADTAEVLSISLETAGFTPIVAQDGSAALRLLQTRSPYLLLLDLRLPDMHGLDVLRFAREQSANLPLIVISGYSEQTDRVTALNAGADDFLTKPFSLEVLLARIHALLRRVEMLTPVPETRLRVRGLELDTARRVAFMRGKKLHLTPIEYSLLLTLMRNADKTVSHDELLRAVWGEEIGSDFSVLRVNISRLRQKLEENPRNPTYIVTAPGQGYIMPLWKK